MTPPVFFNPLNSSSVGACKEKSTLLNLNSENLAVTTFFVYALEVFNKQSAAETMVHVHHYNSFVSNSTSNHGVLYTKGKCIFGGVNLFNLRKKWMIWKFSNQRKTKTKQAEMDSVFKSVVTFGSSCYVVFICRVAFTSEDSYRIAYVKDTLVNQELLISKRMRMCLCGETENRINPLCIWQCHVRSSFVLQVWQKEITM